MIDRPDRRARCGRLSALVLVSASLTVLGCKKAPDGPAPVVWDKEACGYCKMHVGDRAFAAQLQLEGGQVLNFDDPGCLFKYLHEKKPRVHATYFRHHQKDAWLAASEAGFVAVKASPMGFNVGAVEKGAAGAFPVAEAQQRVTGGKSPSTGAPPATGHGTH